MSFSVNHAQASQGRYLPPEGEYEVIIKTAGEKTTQSGKRLISFGFEIRSDVDQDEKGEAFEFGIFPLKTPTARDPEGYRLGTVQAICKAVGIAEGTNFNSLTEWLASLVGMPIKTAVKHREYQGQDQINVNYAPSEFPEVVAGTAVDPSELPF